MIDEFVIYEPLKCHVENTFPMFPMCKRTLRQRQKSL